MKCDCICSRIVIAGIGVAIVPGYDVKSKSMTVNWKSSITKCKLFMSFVLFLQSLSKYSWMFSLQAYLLHSYSCTLVLYDLFIIQLNCPVYCPVGGSHVSGVLLFFSPGKVKAAKAASTVLCNMFQYSKLHKDYKQVRLTIKIILSVYLNIKTELITSVKLKQRFFF